MYEKDFGVISYPTPFLARKWRVVTRTLFVNEIVLRECD